MAFNKLNVVIGANIESLQKELAKVEKSLQRFGRKMQQIGTDLTQTLTVPIAGLGAASLKAFSDIERLEKGLIALMGSSEAAKAEMVKLREVAKLPGLGFEVLECVPKATRDVFKHLGFIGSIDDCLCKLSSTHSTVPYRGNISSSESIL